MIIECRDYLLEKLKEANPKAPVFTEQKKLRANDEKRMAATLIDKEEIKKSGRMKIYKDEITQKDKKRTEKFSRNIYFIVIIGDYSLDDCAVKYEKFISSLDKGLYVDGNWTDMSIEKIDWVDEEDSILKSKITVQMVFKFSGGVFNDTGFKQINIDNVNAEVEGYEQ